MGAAHDDLVLAPPADLERPLEHVQVRHGRRGLGAWSEYLALRATQRVAAHLPRVALEPLIRTLARMGRAVDRRHTRAARDFVRTALPDAAPAEVEALVIGAWRHLVRLAFDSERIAGLLGRRFGDHYSLEACEGFEELRAQRRGCLFVTAHVGNWEALGLPLMALGFNPFYGVGKPPRNDPLARHIQRMREATGARLLPRKGAMRGVPAVIRAGGSVVLLLDHRARVKPVYAPLFARPAACDRSAGVLVRRVGVPIVFGACYNTAERDRYRLVFSRVVEPGELAGLGPEEVMNKVNGEIERLILAQPEQYFWLHDRYKGLPPRERVDASRR